LLRPEDSDISAVALKAPFQKRDADMTGGGELAFAC
jgi:hypothetical protein